MKQTDTRADKSAERFFGALRDVFVGAPVLQRTRAKGEGQNPGFLPYPFSFIPFLLWQSGFINLMRIKSRYYSEGVFPRLQKDIEVALKPFPGFKQELFDKLYDFFHRYFSPSGSIYFQHTPAHKNIYEKVCGQ